MAITKHLSKFHFELVQQTKLKFKIRFWSIYALFPTIILLILNYGEISILYLCISSFFIKEFYLEDKQFRIHKSGYIGEKNCLKTLKKLSNDFIIFNQIEIPSKVSSYNEFETDFIVVGKNTVFIIESKKFNGKIFCEDRKTDWLKTKEDYKGNIIKKKIIKSPFNQIERQKKYLSLFLEKFNLNIEIQTLLFISIKKEKLKLPKVLEIPVFTSKDIVKHIKKVDKTKNSFISYDIRNKVLEILMSLNSESQNARQTRMRDKHYIFDYIAQKQLS